MGQLIADNALSLAGGDKEVAVILTNIGMNIAASGAGAAAGAATGGSSGAINGANIGSVLQQYNAAGGKLAEKLVEAAQKAAQLSGNKTLINLTKNINKVDDVVEAIEHSAVGKKAQEIGDALTNAEFKAADKIEDMVTGEKTPNGGSSELTAEQQQIIENAENVSTANPAKGTYDHPRDLQEQTFWKEVESNPGNPADGKVLEGLNNDPRFPESAGFKKMQARYQNPETGEQITIHYQYNTNTGKAYDMKVNSSQNTWSNPTEIMNSIKGQK